MRGGTRRGSCRGRCVSGLLIAVVTLVAVVAVAVLAERVLWLDATGRVVLAELALDADRDSAEGTTVLCNPAVSKKALPGYGHTG